MATHTAYTATIANGDFLNAGYFNGIPRVKCTASTDTTPTIYANSVNTATLLRTFTFKTFETSDILLNLILKDWRVKSSNGAVTANICFELTDGTRYYQFGSDFSNVYLDASAAMTGTEPWALDSTTDTVNYSNVRTHIPLDPNIMTGKTTWTVKVYTYASATNGTLVGTAGTVGLVFQSSNSNPSCTQS